MVSPEPLPPSFGHSKAVAVRWHFIRDSVKTEEVKIARED